MGDTTLVPPPPPRAGDFGTRWGYDFARVAFVGDMKLGMGFREGVVGSLTGETGFSSEMRRRLFIGEGICVGISMDMYTRDSGGDRW